MITNQAESRTPLLREGFQPAIYGTGGWRRRISRQPGQVRKEAALTSPMRVDVQPLTAARLARLSFPDKELAFRGP